MKFTILTLFPSIVEAFFEASLMQKAVEKSLISYEVINIRDFAEGKHKSCDDVPYGGGAGMVMMGAPIIQALKSLDLKSRGKVIFPTPSGKVFTQKKAYELSEESSLVFICGRYEGLDQRVIDSYVDEELSIGDYVLSSGEIGSLVMIDAIYRLREGVIASESLEEESFSAGLLEYPHYTRPRVLEDIEVPSVLLSGNHKMIAKWREDKSKEKTQRNRPDLWDIYTKNKE